MNLYMYTSYFLSLSLSLSLNCPFINRQQYKTEAKKRKTATEQTRESHTLPSSSPPPPPSSGKRAKSTSSNKKRTAIKTNDTTATTTEYEGIHFPQNLNTPSAVAKVLTQKPGVMTVAQLKRASTTNTCYSGSSSYQLKEAIFLQKVKENVEEEKSNRIRW